MRIIWKTSRRNVNSHNRIFIQIIVCLNIYLSIYVLVVWFFFWNKITLMLIFHFKSICKNNCFLNMNVIFSKSWFSILNQLFSEYECHFFNNKKKQFNYLSVNLTFKVIMTRYFRIGVILIQRCVFTITPLTISSIVMKSHLYLDKLSRQGRVGIQ